MMIIRTYGGDLYDTDRETKIGLKYEGGLFGVKQGGAVRSYDLTLPGTRVNKELFGFSELPEMDGMRESIPVEVQYQGVVMRGRLYLKRWTGKRFEVLLVTGATFTDDRLNEPIVRFFNPPDAIEVEKGMELDTGPIPNFGFYQYANAYGSSNSSGTTDTPPSLFPSTTLGYLIDGAAAGMGYLVNYLNDGSQWFDAYNYGLKLATMRIENWSTLTVDGNAVGGWSPSSATLSPLGLHYVTKRFVRGLFPANKTVYVFEALAPVRVRVDDTLTNYVVSGNGKKILANPHETFDMQMEVGDFFAFVEWDDLVHGHFRDYWNGSTGFQTAIATLSMEVSNSSSLPYDNSVLFLADNMPDVTLAQLLDTYCTITCSTWEIVGNEIRVESFAHRLSNAAHYADLEKLRVSDIGAVWQYVDGFARHNIAHATSKLDTLHDGTPVDTRYRWWRDYECPNDFLEGSTEWAVIPFDDGITGDDVCKTATFDDVIYNPTEATNNYDGVLGIFFANLDGLCGNGAYHLQYVDDNGGLGQEFKSFLRDAVTCEVSLLATLRWFAGLQPVSVVRWHGRSFIVQEASWADGVATLRLVRLPIPVSAVLPPPPPPPLYTDLQYIECTGTQYIDTLYIPSNNTDIYVHYNVNSIANLNAIIFGAALNYNTRAYELFTWGDNQYFTCNNIQNIIKNNITAGEFEFSCQGSVTTLTDNGVTSTYAITKGVFTSPVSLKIFAQDRNGAINITSQAKLYRIIIEENGTVVRDYYPKLRIADSKPGLLDVVNNVFYTNAGSGEFLYA